ncbi:MAG: bifunctional 4-hydroxy-2-oxoglutarate aldolase/2-dehydro-3-deoxy-phosphogluconate aldolase [Cyclobacteriaceae bacterium]
MSKFTRIEVAQKMQETGIVPVFYHPDVNIAKQVMKACYDGGVRVFEFTNRAEFAHEVFAELVKEARQTMPELSLGIGSIVDGPTTALYIQLGADFVVAPVVNEEMARVCNRRKIGWMPGCGSVSEISYAQELGAEVVKIFPGSQVGGPGFVKAVKGPMPWSSIMPTGGVEPTEESLKVWFDAGVHCVGLGSKLFPNDVIAKGDYKWIENKVKQVITMVNKFRGR